MKRIQTLRSFMLDVIVYMHIYTYRNKHIYTYILTSCRRGSRAHGLPTPVMSHGQQVLIFSVAISIGGGTFDCIHYALSRYA